MKKRKMSIQALASCVGVQRQTCYAWIHENQRPKLTTLSRLSFILDVSVTDLIATCYADVEAVRLELLVEIYLALPEKDRRLVHLLVTAMQSDHEQKRDEAEH